MSIDDIDLPEGIDDDDLNEPPVDETADDGAGKYDRLLNENSKKFRLSGMFKDWFLDYSSYVILYRAVPHIIDGLKPVQRRVLHAMHRIDDGSLTKVANIVGQAMQFHPHGDASILGALVTLGQKGLLIDCQGNWGNILTGDPNAAPRYIEARLSKFAKEVMFNPKTTVWMTSYDGRNQEPVNLPVKFPLLLAQGADGIAVGLASKILPHNFNELIDASIDILEGREFELYPDFPTGGFADCTRYNRGQRGGTVKVRARIEKIDKSTLSITEIPYGQTTDRLIESILKAKDKGKIKIKKIADLTTGQANIMIYLPNDVSPDKTIDALYAFTDCEVSISPNACVIIDDKPQFLSIDDILRFNTRHTEDLLGQELRIRLDELEADWHYSSLEKVFFENRVYKLLEADSRTWEDQLDEVFRAMKQYQGLFKKEIVMDDILKLVEKPVRKISKFDTKAVDEKIRGIEDEIDEVRNHLEHLTEFTVNYYRNLKKKYGKDCVRHTEITSFQNIAVTRVVSNNAKLYASYTDGFVGIALKKEDNAEYICDCSDMSEIIVFNKNGKYRVTKVSDKAFFGPDIIYAGLFDRNDQRTTYNVIYRDGRNGPCYAKRFVVGGVTRDKEYDITQGTEGSSILWFTANGNGEAETVKIYLRPRLKLKKLILEYDFSQLLIKGRASRGNLVTKNPVQKILLKSKGISTIGGKDLWFDTDIQRLNEDSRGEYLGQFSGTDHILAIFRDGTYYTTSTDLSNRYQGELLKIEKLDNARTYTALYYDGEVKAFYIKRFSFDISDNTPVSFISDAKGSYLVELNDDRHPQVEVTFGGKNAHRPEETIDAEEFISKKGIAAKGKKVSQYEVQAVRFIEPLHKPEDDIEEESRYGTPEADQSPEDDSTHSIQQSGEEEYSDDDQPTLF
ncbi:MAG: DNA gyrase/topoisomerase IV subunit A [Bacteroidetes bacterium]|uniref:DNA gyrase/topoisomerase IV subunit A n=1 Tax=Candidatus Cryptobacteroides intestinavium TaxID=2840766 RepID=A0A9D9ER51_9BACT|nr:DNA gyrase/topoisomerase IV subunit A [Candidatus Cryptobacteroides intestinavium]